ERGVPLWDALKDQGVQASLQKKSASSVRAFVGTIEEARDLSEAGPVTPVLKLLMGNSGYLDMLRDEHSEEAASRLENLQELINVTAQYDLDDE
ncbi:hypothetical protein ABTN15_19125, partial [Acinetobacter baumannii]